MQRLDQVNEHIRTEFSAILPREIELPDDSLVTVTHVETSRDLKHAKLFISILPQDREEEIFSYLVKQLPHLQQELVPKLTMKFSPKLSLAIDEQAKHASHIDALLDNLSEDL